MPEERTLDKFIEYAAKSPKIIPFINAIEIQFGELTTIPGTATRGEVLL